MDRLGWPFFISHIPDKHWKILVPYKIILKTQIVGGWAWFVKQNWVKGNHTENCNEQNKLSLSCLLAYLNWKKNIEYLTYVIQYAKNLLYTTSNCIFILLIVHRIFQEEVQINLFGLFTRWHFGDVQKRPMKHA